MNAVFLDHATLAVGGATVLSDISLAIGAGEFIGVLGPNGSGKTTMMRAVLGLLKPVSGRIEVLGRAPARGNPEIGYLPQTRSAPPAARLSGWDFLASSINGHRFGLPRLSAADRTAIEASLDHVGGAALARRPLSSLSGGERQRLLIAEALIGAPRLLVLDEPLIGLDPHQQHVVVDLVRRLSREMGLTVLFSAHELNQLLGAVDRILYLGQKRAALGTVEEVITPAVLSPLFGAPIQVIRAGGRVFVLSEGEEIEREHAHHGSDHAHL